MPFPDKDRGLQGGWLLKITFQEYKIKSLDSKKKRVVAEPGVFRCQQGKAGLSPFVLCGREDIPNQTPVMRRHCVRWPATDYPTQLVNGKQHGLGS